jgi:heme exporter protein C
VLRPAERMMGRLTARPGERILGWVSLAALIATAIMALAVVPNDAQQGTVYRLMYVHVPAAWLAYLSFGVVFVASIAYLKSGKSRWDRLAAASAEIGVLFTALTIALGSIWGKPIWGTWWTWDPRLTTTAIMLLIYVGYLAVRKLSDNPRRRGRWAAVVGIVGFADIPIVQLSVDWWRGLHQEQSIKLGSVTIAPIMLWTLLLAVAAFTVVYLYLMSLRLRVGRLEERAVAEALSPRVGRPAEALLSDEEQEPASPEGSRSSERDNRTDPTGHRKVSPHA